MEKINEEYEIGFLLGVLGILFFTAAQSIMGGTYPLIISLLCMFFLAVVFFTGRKMINAKAKKRAENGRRSDE